MNFQRRKTFLEIFNNAICNQLKSRLNSRAQNRSYALNTYILFVAIYRNISRY